MIDLRSDTVTKPTQAMRQAAFDAAVGDDVYGEDPSVLELESVAAATFGKEAAMFVPSGTQGNQIAVLTHCRPGDEIILEKDSHIFFYEGATIAAFAGVQPRAIEGDKGMMLPEDVENAIREDDIHQPETSLICLENTHNRAGGAIISLENMKKMHQIGQKYNIPIHLDGARIFNASVATGIDVSTYAQYTDTVQFCLSKGLGAPVGSIIAGSHNFIKRARKWRKRLGGGLRQVGIIAAPGLVALETMVDRLQEDHDGAKELAVGIRNLPGLQVENDVDTNIVLMNTKNLGKTADVFVKELREKDVLANKFGPYTIRFTTYYGVNNKDIQTTIDKISSLL